MGFIAVDRLSFETTYQADGVLSVARTSAKCDPTTSRQISEAAKHSIQAAYLLEDILSKTSPSMEMHSQSK